MHWAAWLALSCMTAAAALLAGALWYAAVMRRECVEDSVKLFLSSQLRAYYYYKVAPDDTPDWWPAHLREQVARALRTSILELDSGAQLPRQKVAADDRAGVSGSISTPPPRQPSSSLSTGATSVDWLRDVVRARSEVDKAERFGSDVSWWHPLGYVTEGPQTTPSTPRGTSERSRRHRSYDNRSFTPDRPRNHRHNKRSERNRRHGKRHPSHNDSS